MLSRPFTNRPPSSATLDHVDRRISRYIRAKQRLIELLEEERDALMQAVTLNPETQELRLGIVAEQALRSVERRDAKTYEPIGLRNRGRGIFHKLPTVGSDLGDSSFFWVRGRRSSAQRPIRVGRRGRSGECGG